MTAVAPNLMLGGAVVLLLSQDASGVDRVCRVKTIGWPAGGTRLTPESTVTPDISNFALGHAPFPAVRVSVLF